MKTNIYTNNMKRWLSALLITVVAVLPAAATSNYYYKATANVSPNGAGKVYIGTTASTPSASDYVAPSYTTPRESQGGLAYSSADVTLYLHAMANEDWIFDHWEENGRNIGTSANLNVQRTTDETNRNYPEQFTFTAIFKLQTGLIKVASADIHKGTVAINNPDNVLGDEVVLTANPDVANGVRFLGWSKGSASTTYVSTDNPYTLIANDETQGTYYANFSEPLTTVYCRIKNKASGNFISFYGDNNGTKAPNHTIRESGRDFNDGFLFTNSIQMISAADAQGNPSTVLLRSGSSAGIGTTDQGDLSFNDIAYHELINPSSVGRSNCPLTFERQADGTYRIYTTVTMSYSSSTLDATSYLCDTGTGWAQMQTRGWSTNQDVWEVYFLESDATEGAFGANTKAKFTRDGKYYTTMYTPFAYQLLDDVKAYYLPIDEELTSYDEENNSVSFTEVTGGKVPAHTAVILECTEIQNTSGTTVNNRLLPLKENVPAIVGESLNLLKGYAPINGATRTNDKDRMYVLSSNNEKLGFFHSSKATMTPFKAYLELPEVPEEVENTVKRMTFSFGEEDEVTPTKVELIPTETVDEDAPIYDLMGRRVKNAVKGIYIQNGKKFIKK